MRKLTVLVVASAVVLIGHRTSAQQTLTDSLFQRYLEALRIETGVPGMSGMVLHDGNVVWEGHFGHQDVESSIAPTRLTPYAIGGLSQIFGATLLLKECVEEDVRDVTAPVTDWIPNFSEPDATLVNLLAHIQPNASFRYDLGRYSLLTPIVSACGNEPYPQLLAEEVFGRLGLLDSVPGTSVAALSTIEAGAFDPDTLARYGSVIARMATPYTVDTRGRATRTELPRGAADASTGVVTTLRDLATFDSALGHETFVSNPTQVHAWTRPVAHLPTGLGWLLQNYNGHAIVWQFGSVANAYSSLIVKVPNRQLTFILLANSDRLSSPFTLENGDVNASVFARLFLRLYVP